MYESIHLWQLLKHLELIVGLKSQLEKTHIGIEKLSHCMACVTHDSKTGGGIELHIQVAILQ
jgi:hypothetical protein